MCIHRAYECQGLRVPTGITAHSSRAAVTSAAFSTRAPIAEICRAETWSSFTTFVRHYRIDQQIEAAFGRRVLQRVLNQ